jgi:hypothetical protein
MSSLALARKRLIQPLRPLVARAFDLHLHQDALSFEMRERIVYDDGYSGPKVTFDSDWWQPNAMANEGQAEVLNVVWRGTSPVSKYLALLNMPSSTPSKTTTMSSMVEATTAGTNGYSRQQLLTSDWSSPALDSGDEQTQAAQKTFGAFTANVPVSHVCVVSTSTGTSGIFILYVPTAYFTANAAARTYVSGESYLVTLRDKQV